ncbi:MAG TPA: phBC6A51 family helix-turn-helix protein [Methanothrix soehngenii]|nr:phBC6A51 family helix-turn-helix protein [Methanothrix soehngenii]
MTHEPTKSDKIRPLSVEQQNAIEFLIQGRSDRSVAEAIGVNRSTIWEWRKNPIFVAALNKQRNDMWKESRERLKTLASFALDTIERQLANDDGRIALDASKLILKSNRLLGETDLPLSRLEDPRAIIFDQLKREAQDELLSKADLLDRNPYRIALEAEALARSRMAKAMEEAGL